MQSAWTQISENALPCPAKIWDTVRALPGDIYPHHVKTVRSRSPEYARKADRRADGCEYRGASARVHPRVVEEGRKSC